MFKGYKKCAFTLAEGATHVGKFKGYKKCAFTLAEVLVTLGIIGVVSAMTIPSLTQNWQKKAYVTQLHKVYNIFQQAFLEEINDKQAINLIEAGVHCGAGGSVSQFLHNHFKVVKDCGMNSSSGCFASSYRNLNGTGFSRNFPGYNVTIAGGASIAYDGSYYWNGMKPDTNAIAVIYVDTNGPKGPNISGRDLFVMTVYPDGSIDEFGVSPACRKNGGGSCASGGSATATRNNYFNNYCKNQTTGWYCFGKLLNDNWEMNY